MREFLRWIIGAVVSVAAILFAVTNRALVPVIWSPLNPPAQFPLYGLVLGGVVIGFCIGAMLVWLDASTLRRERRAQRRKIMKLEQALDGTAKAPVHLVHDGES